MTQIFLLTRNGQQQNNTLITISAGQSGRLAYLLPFINLCNKGKQSEKASWWINELDSLGIKKVIITKPNQITFKTRRIFLMI